ncbi:hypothetical protein [Nostoc sp.]|uniref:hypothetical protein n=1 Tax=Nostoc sp. TaxID=1180 RepID=UPI002FF9B344
MGTAKSQKERRTARKPLDFQAVEEVPTANLFAVNYKSWKTTGLLVKSTGGNYRKT